MNIIGAFEYVDLPLLNIERVLAKIDTGASISAIHSTFQEITLISGIEYLSFNVIKPNLILKTKDYSLVNVTNSFGEQEKKYKINLITKINNSIFENEFILSDRSNLEQKILIGKNIIDKGNFVIDIKKQINESKNSIICCDNCKHKWEKNQYSKNPEHCISCGFDNKSGKFIKNISIKEQATSTYLHGGGNYNGQMPSYNAYDRKAWTEYPSDERGILARRILDDLTKRYDGDEEKALEQFSFSYPNLIIFL